LHNPVKISRLLEIFLYAVSVTAFIALLAVQVTIQYPGIRNILVWQDSLDGTLLGKEEYLFERAVVNLWLDEKDVPSGDNIMVLVNGDVAADFGNGKVSLEVADGDVIEIDGSNIGRDVKVNAEITVDTGGETNKGENISAGNKAENAADMGANNANQYDLNRLPVISSVVVNSNVVKLAKINIPGTG